MYDSSVLHKLQLLAQLRLNLTLSPTTLTLIDITSYFGSFCLYWRSESSHSVLDTCSSIIYSTLQLINDEESYNDLIIPLYRAFSGVWTLAETYSQDMEFVVRHIEVMNELVQQLLQVQGKYEEEVKNMEGTPQEIFNVMYKKYTMEEDQEVGSQMIIHPVYGYISRYQIEYLIRKYGRHILYLSLTPILGPVPSYLLSQALKRN